MNDEIRSANFEASERESILNYTADSELATFYTRIKSDMTRLDKLVAKNPQEYSLICEERIAGQTISKTYSMPKSLVTFRARTITRDLSEEQRQNLSAIAKKNFFKG